MKHCKVIVEDYGKMKHAELNPASLTLFIGDNNSGKSYLMSLLWGIQSLGVNNLLGESSGDSTEKKGDLCQWMKEKIENCRQKGTEMIPVQEISSMLQAVLDEGLADCKDSLVRKIFNSTKVSIGNLKIILQDLDDIGDLTLVDKRTDHAEMITLEENGIETSGLYYSDERKEIDIGGCWFLVRMLYCIILDISYSGNSQKDAIYLPAARTGFMLTKDIINSVGRENTFNMDGEAAAVTPFVRPINQFLDIINSLMSDHEEYSRRTELIQYLENDMVTGQLDLSSMPNQEVLYVPNGKSEGMPLRTVSAVVSELSPLILILKHKKDIKSFYYEEPEMCLHPQLQNKVAKLICNLVNLDIDMFVTTHSDIILQYINNMIRLSENENQEQILNALSYTTKDMVNRNQVRVYQLCNHKDGYSTVEELSCGEYGFEAETFNHALDKIMEEGYTIQG